MGKVLEATKEHKITAILRGIDNVQRMAAEEVVNVLSGNEPFSCVNRRTIC